MADLDPFFPNCALGQDADVAVVDIVASCVLASVAHVDALIG